MSDLSNWIANTLGADAQWPMADGLHQIPNQRAFDIIAHYEREIDRGRLTMPQAYERACSDIQGRNGHASRPQRGKAYLAVSFKLTRATP